MHFEINVPPGDPRLTALVRKITSGVTAQSAFLPGIDSYLDSAAARHIFGATRSGQLRELTNRTGGWQNLDATNGGYIVGAPAVTRSGDRMRCFRDRRQRRGIHPVPPGRARLVGLAVDGRRQPGGRSASDDRQTAARTGYSAVNTVGAL